MTKKNDKCKSRETTPIIIFTLGISCLLFVLILGALNYLPSGSERVVNVELMGERLCESKGLEFKNFSITKEQIPNILCVEKNTLPIPIMDGILYVEKKQ